MPQAALLDAQLRYAYAALLADEVSMPQAALLDAQQNLQKAYKRAIREVSMPQAALLDAQQLIMKINNSIKRCFNAASGIA